MISIQRKKHFIKTTFKTLVRSIWEGYQIIPWGLSLLFLVNFLLVPLSYAFVAVNERVFDLLSRQGSNQPSSLPMLLLILVLIQLLEKGKVNLFRNYYTVYYPLLTFEKRIKMKLHQHAQEISSEEFEGPMLHRKILKAKNASLNIFRLNEVLIYLACLIFSTTFVLKYLVKLNVFLALFLLMALIPLVVNQVYDTHLQKASREKLSSLEGLRKAYYDTMMKLDFFVESSINKGLFLLKRNWLRTIKEEGTEKLSMAKKKARIGYLTSILSVLAQGGAMVFCLSLLYRGSLSLGEFVAAMTAYQIVKGQLEEFFDLLGHLSHFSVLVGPYFEFLSITPPKIEGEKAKGVLLSEVSFTYPNASKPAIDKISLQIDQGKSIAIVGKNGQGKSTLAKLLLGIYKPTTGQARVYQPSLTSALFQEFGRYALSFHDNLVLSDYKKKRSINELEEILLKSGLQEYRYRLTKDHALLGLCFGHQDLSGGNWQRLGLARSLYRRHDLLVLDEPTSAIDPIFEREFINSLVRESQEKTSVFITHRLGSAKKADLIVVLEQGRIVESGKHEDLLNRKHHYYDLWTSQAGWFKREKA